MTQEEIKALIAYEQRIQKIVSDNHMSGYDIIRFAEDMSLNGITVKVDKGLDWRVEINWPCLGGISPMKSREFLQELQRAQVYADVAQEVISAQPQKMASQLAMESLRK